MKQIKKFKVSQTAKVMALLYLVISAVILIPVGLFTLATGGKTKEGIPWLFIIFLPLIYAAISFILVALTCFVYNFIAARIGGVEIEFYQD